MVCPGRCRCMQTFLSLLAPTSHLLHGWNFLLLLLLLLDTACLQPAMKEKPPLMSLRIGVQLHMLCTFKRPHHAAQATPCLSSRFTGGPACMDHEKPKIQAARDKRQGAWWDPHAPPSRHQPGRCCLGWSGAL